MTTIVSESATTLDHPPELDDRSLMGHPRGLGLLFVVEMWERFSYYGMRALLVLYLVNALGWADGRALNLYGTYTALVYLTPLIGGYLADRFVGTRRSLVIGGIIIALGHFVLAFGPSPIPQGGVAPAFAQMIPFYIGLGLVIIGTGFFKPNVSTMVGQIYREGDPRRDSGFTIFYMGINLGAFLAPLVCGWLGQRVGWHYGFGAAGVGMLVGLAIYLWGRDRYLPGIGTTISGRRASPDLPGGGTAGLAEGVVPAAIGAVAGGAIGGLLGVVLGSGVSLFGIFVGATAGAAIGFSVLGSHGEERKRVIAIFIVALFVTFFWMGFEQAGGTMNLFADRYTDLTVAGFEIPSSWFQSVNSAFILIFALPFAALWIALGRRRREPSTALKMVFGLFLLGIAFLFMVLGGRGADAGIKVSPMWLVMAYLFQTFGELCLSPVGLSYVTKVAPLRFASLLMGVWFLANGAANFLAGQLGRLTERVASQADFFMIPLGISFGAAILMLLLVPVLKTLTRTVKA